MISNLRQLKLNFLSFAKGHPGIFLFGLRRGGTTMVADAIMANRGIYNVNEPFAVLPVHPAYEMKKQMLPPAPHSHFFNLHGDDLEKFSEYVEKLEHAKLRMLGGVQNPIFPLRANRVSLKILNAPWMVDWFVENTDGQVLVMLRHPGAQATSVMRQGWEYPVMAYLQRLEELEHRLTSDQVDMMRILCKKRNDWQKAILDWCVTSLPLRAASGERVIKFTYEDILADPVRFVTDILSQQCGLSDQEAMLASLKTPSNSSKMNTAETTASILAGDKKELMEKWRASVTEEMAREAQAILDVFEVTEYRFCS